MGCQEKKKGHPKLEKNKVTCTDIGCFGTYKGPEFINRSDVAHQFSNTMSEAVGDQLKQLYREGNYSKIDFDNIVMTTKGMGTGNVNFHLSMPFIRVAHKCEAYTSFDHVGGWNHAPALKQRKEQLRPLLFANDQLQVSALKTTTEGLEEYWIQWRHKDVQKDCN